MPKGVRQSEASTHLAGAPKISAFDRFLSMAGLIEKFLANEPGRAAVIPNDPRLRREYLRRLVSSPLPGAICRGHRDADVDRATRTW